MGLSRVIAVRFLPQMGTSSPTLADTLNQYHPRTGPSEENPGKGAAEQRVTLSCNRANFRCVNQRRIPGLLFHSIIFRPMDRFSTAVAALHTGLVVGLGLASLTLSPRAWSREDATGLTVCLFSDAGAGEPGAALARLQKYLEKDLPGKYVRVPGSGTDRDRAAIRAALGSSDVAVLFDQQEPLTAEGLELVRKFVAQGKGVVVLRSRAGTSEAWKKFQDEVLGVRYAGPLPKDARLTSISLYPHPVLTAETDRFETREDLLRATVKDDAVIIMEGEVGEFSVPMAWLRSYQGGRVFGLMPGEAALFQDPAYLKIVANGIRSVSGRSIPGARTSVQRTYMADAHPGAFAITFPGGPGVCYDPDHGGVAYVWAGDYVDARRWYTARHGAAMKEFAARYAGEVFYREDLTPALRSGGPTDSADWRYLGFQMRGDHPEFRYKVGGRIVTESLQATADGLGIVRRYTVGPGEGPLSVSIGRQDRTPATEDKASVTVDGAMMTENGDRVRFDPAGGGEFTVTIRRKGDRRSDRK